MPNFFNFRSLTELQRYKKWREIGMKLNHKIMEQASKDTILRAARDLRLLRKKDDIIRCDSETDTHFLMDRVVHDVLIDGKRAVEIYRGQNAQRLTEDERTLLDALVDARYSLFVVRQIEPGKGLHLLDVFSEETMFLTDVNLSQTALEGNLLAGRAVSVDGITFTSGCACPFPAKLLPPLKDNFIQLFEKKKHQMMWTEMMRQYNPYFFITMKRLGTEIDFMDVI